MRSRRRPWRSGAGRKSTTAGSCAGVLQISFHLLTGTGELLKGMFAHREDAQRLVEIERQKENEQRRAKAKQMELQLQNKVGAEANCPVTRQTHEADLIAPCSRCAYADLVFSALRRSDTVPRNYHCPRYPTKFPVISLRLHRSPLLRIGSPRGILHREKHGARVTAGGGDLHEVSAAKCSDNDERAAAPHPRT